MAVVIMMLPLLMLHTDAVRVHAMQAGTEAWFESTIRTDVNGGVNTREALRTKDPRLSALLQEVFGDGPWRYGHRDVECRGLGQTLTAECGSVCCSILRCDCCKAV